MQKERCLRRRKRHGLKIGNVKKEGRGDKGNFSRDKKKGDKKEEGCKTKIGTFESSV